VENNNNSESWGRELDFAVHASVYGKVQAEPNVNPDNQERRNERKEASRLPELGCLATYIGYVACVSVCLGWGWYQPHHTIQQACT
jgi:hypothetical protein